ncbi:MAG: conjugative transposon protein TraN [Bacteroidetes bacterium 43-16]|nr:MAG: conjugative transposon protein TraN [Bacteroidetes bacterium 43-16]
MFPYSIISVDRGSSEVLVQKVPQAENVLQLKADTKEFEPTNLTVITAEGSLYSFLLYYDSEPLYLNLKVQDLEIPAAQFVKIDGQQSEAVLYEAGRRIAVKQPFINRLKDQANAMSLSVSGIYVHNDVLYFQLSLENNSNINYDVSQFRFYIQDSKRSKRTARQELILDPLYVTGNIKRIEGGSKQTAVIAYEKFTIPNKKHLRVEIQEHNGGRQLELKIRNKDLLKARAL